MPLYLVSYDIAEKNDQEYKPLRDYLDSLGSLRVLYSEYASPFTGSALELATGVNKFLKAGDHLLVSELFKGGNPSVVVRGALASDVQKFDALLNTNGRTAP